MDSVMEQPTLNSGDVSEQIADEGKAIENTEGSMFGKFKDATSLLSAYQTLEKEFTRKSQKLSALQKEIETHDAEKTQNVNKNIEKHEQNNQNAETNANEQTQPLYLKSDWRARVRAFDLSHPDYKEFSKEMANILASDRQLAQSQNCLSLAYHMAKSLRPAALEKPNPANTELNKQQIIDEYLRDVLASKNNVRLISGEESGATITSPKVMPKTIKEASQIFKNLLEK